MEAWLNMLYVIFFIMCWSLGEIALGDKCEKLKWWQRLLVAWISFLLVVINIKLIIFVLDFLINKENIDVILSW